LTPRWILFAVLSLSFLFRFWLSTDTYLHEFDERYHALVAKHLIEHPLKPTLYENPVEPYDHKDWINNHIWLSKPPIPLWLMAGSLKVFGLNEIAVRIPALILATLAALLVFLIARKFCSEKYAVLAASMFAFHGMMTDLCTGRLSSDSVETCFLFFITWGMYLIFRKPLGSFSIKDYLLVGVMTGLAFLSKWQPALLIPLVAFIAHLKKDRILNHLLGMTLMMTVAILIGGAWIGYCYTHYPIEADWLIHSLFLPVYDSSVSPDGTWYSYLTDFGNFFGYTTYILVILFGVRVVRESSDRGVLLQRIALLIWAILPLILFSFAEAKRGTYIFISAPAIFILIAYSLEKSVGWKTFTRWISVVSVGLIFIYSIDKGINIIGKDHSRAWSDELKARKYNGGEVIHGEPHYIEAMFYHNITAYPN
jgi:4-amino-4-deoxy-L-arabinose transferase-like glycosyltransferase